MSLEEKRKAWLLSGCKLLELSQKIVTEAPAPFCMRAAHHNQRFVYCKTCSTNLPCVLCIHCFTHGNHEGHKFSMVTEGDLVPLACCCGQPERCPRTSFCSCHSGIVPESHDDPKVVNELMATFKAYMSGVLSASLSCSEMAETWEKLFVLFEPRHWRVLKYFDECFADTPWFESLLQQLAFSHKRKFLAVMAMLEEFKMMPVFGKAWYSRMFHHIHPVINEVMSGHLGRFGSLRIQMFFKFTGAAIPHGSDSGLVDTIVNFYERLFAIDTGFRQCLGCLADLGSAVCYIQKQSFGRRLVDRLVPMFVKQLVDLWLPDGGTDDPEVDSSRIASHELFRLLTKMMSHDPEIAGMVWACLKSAMSATTIESLLEDSIFDGDVLVPASSALGSLLLKPLKGKTLDERKEWIAKMAQTVGMDVDGLLMLPLLYCVRYLASIQFGEEQLGLLVNEMELNRSIERRHKSENCYWLLQCIFQLFSSPEKLILAMVAAFGVREYPMQAIGLLISLAILLFDRSFSGDRVGEKLLMVWLHIEKNDMTVDALSEELGDHIVNLPLSEVVCVHPDPYEGTILRRRPDFKWHIICPSVGAHTLVNNMTEFCNAHRDAWLPFPEWVEDESLSRFLTDWRVLLLEYMILQMHAERGSCDFAVLIVYRLIKLAYDLFGCEKAEGDCDTIDADSVDDLFTLDWTGSFGEFLHTPIRLSSHPQAETIIDLVKKIGGAQSAELLSHLGIEQPESSQSAQPRKERARRAKEAVLKQMQHPTDALTASDEEEDTSLTCVDCGRGTDDGVLCYPMHWFCSSAARILAQEKYQAVICLHPCHEECLAQNESDEGYTCSLDRRFANRRLPILKKFDAKISDSELAALMRFFEDFDPIGTIVSEITIQECRSRSLADFYSASSGVMVSELFNCCWIAHRCAVPCASSASSPLGKFIQRLIESDNPEMDFDSLAQGVESRHRVLAQHMIFHPMSKPDIALVPDAPKSIAHANLPEIFWDFMNAPWDITNIDLVGIAVDLLTGELCSVDPPRPGLDRDIKWVLLSDETVLLAFLTEPLAGNAIVVCPAHPLLALGSLYGNDDGIIVPTPTRGEVKLDKKKLENALDMFVSGRWTSKLQMESDVP